MSLQNGFVPQRNDTTLKHSTSGLLTGSVSFPNEMTLLSNTS